MALARKILKKYIPSANPNDGYYIAGIATAMSMVDVLKRAGKNPTRALVMKAARSQNQAKHPLVVPGIVIKTAANDGFPMEQVSLQRWVSGKGSAAGHWSLFGRSAPRRASAASRGRPSARARACRSTRRARSRPRSPRPSRRSRVWRPSRSLRSAKRQTAVAKPRRW